MHLRAPRERVNVNDPGVGVESSNHDPPMCPTDRSVSARNAAPERLLGVRSHFDFPPSAPTEPNRTASPSRRARRLSNIRVSIILPHLFSVQSSSRSRRAGANSSSNSGDSHPPPVSCWFVPSCAFSSSSGFKGYRRALGAAIFAHESNPKFT